MPEQPPPGEPGYDPDKWFQHVVNVGLRLAREVGTGLSLVNALVGRFAGVPRSILGSAATILGQGIRAAAAWMAGGPDHVVDLTTLPLAPPGFFGPEEVSRIVAVADVAGIDSATGNETERTTRINFSEDWSKAAVEDAVEAVAEEDAYTSPENMWDVEREQSAHMIWIGKKY